MDHSALTPAAPRGASFKLPHPNRRTLVKGVAWSVPTIAISSSAAVAAVSPPGAAGCYPEGTLFDAQARGRLLSGSILGIDLDTIAELEGVWARAFDSTAEDDRNDPLSVEALSALNVQLGGIAGITTNLLDLLVDQETGVANQYAYANAEAEIPGAGEIGGAGTVGDDGAISLSQDDPNPPALGTIDLHALLSQLAGDSLADLLTSVTDLDLEVGAVAGLAQFDSLCEVPELQTVTRDYLAAYLRMNVTSNVVGAVVSAIPDELNVSPTDVLNVLDNFPLLGDLVDVLTNDNLNVEVAINTDALTTRIPDDPNAALALDLGAGSIDIDLAALLGEAYTGGISPWLNSLAPNTRLFVDPVAELPGDAVTSLLNAWAQTLFERLQDLITVTISASVLGLVNLNIEGTLAELLAGEFTAEARVFALLGWATIDFSTILDPLGEGLAELVQGALDGLLEEGQALATALQGVNTVLSGVFSALEDVINITINAQNATVGTVPGTYAGLPAGRYDVAAIHLAAVNGNLLGLSLGRGSVGENTARSTGTANRGIQLPF